MRSMHFRARLLWIMTIGTFAANLALLFGPSLLEATLQPSAAEALSAGAAGVRVLSGGESSVGVAAPSPPAAAIAPGAGAGAAPIESFPRASLPGDSLRCATRS